MSKTSKPSTSSDLESNNGGVEDEACEPTTFRMLIEKMQVSDAEFIDCCQEVGLIASKATCSQCSKPMVLVVVEGWVDGVEWRCPLCSLQRTVREESWLEDIRQVRLKDIILILYLWSRNYPEQLAQHEAELSEVTWVPIIYKKCRKLSAEYFQNEMCNIGGPGEVIEIEEFSSKEGLPIVGGVERHNMKNVFFRVLPENWTRNHLITAIIDNSFSGSILHFQNSRLVSMLGEEGVDYLRRVWSLEVEASPRPDNPMVISLWALFEKLFKDRHFTEESVLEFLFRRRMDTATDPFLFLLSTISELHPPAS